MSPGQETDGASTVQATVTVKLSSDPMNPTVAITVT